jgi:UDP-N-acetylglucosamine 2-epimerase (non-hydrolysing)
LGNRQYAERPKVLTIVGTRPEAIKMLPLIRGLRLHGRFQVVSVTTGQHREMLDQVFEAFGEKPDYALDVMRHNQSLVGVTTSVLSGISEVYSEHRPDLVLVQGDTTTAMASAVAAFYAHIPVGHVEAGLRSRDLQQPWPEEFNRVCIDSIAELMFAPTAEARTNLLAEYNRNAPVYVTGNTGIDALLTAAKMLQHDAGRRAALAKKYEYLDDNARLILVTGHRRENIGAGFEKICDALTKIASREDVQLLYPVHLNPNVRATVLERLGPQKNVYLIDPVGFFDMVYLMQRAYFVITDSGGIQEEAPALARPVLVTRNTTERPEALRTGNVKLVGTDSKAIFGEAALLLDDEKVYRERARAVFPYGDGKASDRIIRILERYFGLLRKDTQLSDDELEFVPTALYPAQTN